KITFVPAGHEYQEWDELSTDSRRLHFYFDPATLGAHYLDGVGGPFAPRLLFEDATLWQTALKLKSLIEGPELEDRLYFEVLGRPLVHELVVLNRGAAGLPSVFRGGLTPWQQRIVSAYIEEHFAQKIPTATLARLIGLSRFHFCRTF